MAKSKTSSGLDENVAAGLSYVLGLITGLIFYFVEEKNKFVRFHAMQSIMFSLSVIVIYVILLIISPVMIFIPIVGWIFVTLIYAIVWIGALVVWVILIVKALQHEKFKLPFIGDLAEKYV